MSPPCDSVHMRYVDRGVVDYAKALVRTVRRGEIANFGAALKRLIQAVERLEAEDAREKARGPK